MCGPAIVPGIQAIVAATTTAATAVGTGLAAVGTWAGGLSAAEIGLGLSAGGLVDADQKYKVGKSEAKKAARSQRLQAAEAGAAERRKGVKAYRPTTKRKTGRRTLRVG